MAALSICQEEKGNIRTCSLDPTWLPRFSVGTAWAAGGRLASGESLRCHQHCPLMGPKSRGGGGTA